MEDFHFELIDAPTQTIAPDFKRAAPINSTLTDITDAYWESEMQKVLDAEQARLEQPSALQKQYVDHFAPESSLYEGEFGFSLIENASPDKQEFSPFEEALSQAENDQSKGKDKHSGRWTPHASVEGGLPTLAYGHKLTEEEANLGRIFLGNKVLDIKKGITENEAKALFKQDVNKAKSALSKRIVGFTSLPKPYQEILVNLQFNTGGVSEQSWPRLLRHMRSGYDEGVKQEMITSYRDEDGKRVRLLNRANKIAGAVGL